MPNFTGIKIFVLHRILLDEPKQNVTDMTKEIETREDVYNLVITFYGKIREDDLLGPIFNRHISDWDTHFELLTDFWESNLFFVKKYTGNPLLKHQEVDASEAYAIDQHHFGTWLNIWFQTITELYHGEKANIAKNRARNMSTFFYLSIFKARTEGKNKPI